MTLQDNPLVLEISAIILLEKVDGGDLSEVPDSLLDRWQSLGFNAVWIMGVWTTGERSRDVSVALSDGYSESLPDWTEADVCGSPYAVKEYRVHPRYGGDQALAKLRERMARRGLGLILDFVPNHVALDHPWVNEYPDFFIEGDTKLLAKHPENYTLCGDKILAHGRDPYFSGWSDTLQLDYRQESTRQEMISVLGKVAGQCDAVRCDMAMLLLSDVFINTWGHSKFDSFGKQEFWAEAVDRIRKVYPDFKFIAEVYWGLEQRMQLLGFDYTYHKSHYDLLVHKQKEQLSGSLADPDYVRRSLYFIENHDEPRAAKTFPEQDYRHTIIFHLLTLPGMRLIHDGQMEGYHYHHSVHLGRRHAEQTNKEESDYYTDLLDHLQDSLVGRGQWRLLKTDTASLLAYLWESDSEKEMCVINLGKQECAGHVLVQSFEIGGREWRLSDRLSDQEYLRCGTEMSTSPGLYVKLQPFEGQLFQLSKAS